MSEVAWWSRLAIWTGAVILVAQSLTGQRSNALTVVAVVLLCLGILGFVGGLILTHVPITLVNSPADEVRETRQSEASVVEASVGEVKPRGEDREIEATAPLRQAAGEERVDGRVQTAEVRKGDPAYGALCPRCGKRVSEGELVATCPVCGTRQHAGCWTNNRFRCSVSGCIGRGSLEAPQERETAGREEHA